MKNIIVDFENLIEEMKEKQINLLLLNGRNDWFIIDNKNQIYKIETYYCGGYLDKYIINKTKIDFDLLPISVSKNIEDQEMEIWGIEKVKDFIKKTI